jgi:hypothetical protein
MPTVPYSTSTGIKIGNQYTPPKMRESDPDMLAWQQVLSPSLQKYQRRWIAKMVVCFLISGLLFTYWNLYA